MKRMTWARFAPPWPSNTPQLLKHGSFCALSGRLADAAEQLHDDSLSARLAAGAGSLGCPEVAGGLSEHRPSSRARSNRATRPRSSGPSSRR